MPINFKSDAMNPPTDAMWDAMRSVEPGWVLDRDDATVRRLESAAAALAGKPAAVFLPTGRMACLVALMTFCERGTQIILDRRSHIAWCQEWNYASIAGLVPRYLQTPAPDEVETAITEAHFGHQPETSLVCLENTHTIAGGTCLTTEETRALSAIAHRHDVPVFLDGARLLYAAVALGTSVAELAAPADVVMFSLTKGIGAPVGAMLCGDADAMEGAWENARRLGVASLMFAGPLAAAGLVALETMAPRLGEDIRNARLLGHRLNAIDGIAVDLASLQTNIVMADVSGCGLNAATFVHALAGKGIAAHRLSDSVVRFTTHRLIGPPEMDRLVDAAATIAMAWGAGAATDAGG